MVNQATFKMFFLSCSLTQLINFQMVNYYIITAYIFCFIATTQMDYLSNAEVINKIAASALQPKQSLYSEDPLYVALESLPNIGYADPAVYNRYRQRLKVSLFYHHGQPRNNCIVFMHGFGSNRFQALNILPHLPSHLSLCCFDFSAQGKSQGRMVTYGKKQKDDIRAIIGYLRNCKFKSIVLWGRSMGASSALYYAINEQPHDVALQILDSPYSSFAEVAYELTKKKINLPDFVLQTGLQAMKKNFQTRDFNPFQVDFNKPLKCSIPTIFVYSEDDDVINWRNTQSIINNFKGRYEKVIIKENHNAIRTPNSIKIILDLVKKYTGKPVSRKMLHSSQKVIGFHKRVGNNRNAVTEDSFDNYGIWVTSKLDKTKAYERSQLSRSIDFSAKKTRPKSSIKVFSANMSVQFNKMQDSPKEKRMNQSMMGKTLSRQIEQENKKIRYLSHDFYL